MIVTKEQSTGSTASNPLTWPAYRSHKTVLAVKIGSVEQSPATEESSTGGTWRIQLDEPAGYGPVTVPHDFIQKHSPQSGGYLVRYTDGYTSYSPAAAFLDGNTPAHRWGILRSQEPKYTVSDLGRLVNRLTGVPIPDEEPVFVFRAKDLWALGALQAYRRQLIASSCDPDHIKVVDDRIRDFEAFAEGFPDRMRAPNSPIAVTTPFQGSQA